MQKSAKGRSGLLPVIFAPGYRSVFLYESIVAPFGVARLTIIFFALPPQRGGMGILGGFLLFRIIENNRILAVSDDLFVNHTFNSIFIGRKLIHHIKHGCFHDRT